MSTTAGARLAFLSGLTGVSAQTHLRQIAGFYGVAAAMLVAFSGYPTAPAWVHLYPDSRVETVGGSSYDRISPEWSSTKRKRLVEEALRGQPLQDTDIAILSRALNAFLEAGRPTNDAAGRDSIRSFLDDTVERLVRADAARRSATEQITQDFVDAMEQQRLNNRRRAIILIVLLMLS